MDLALKLYEKMPPFMQDAATTVRGLKLRRLRYTARTWEMLDRLREQQWWPKEKLEDLQAEKLLRMVRHAYDTVPMYRRNWDLANIKPGDVRSLADIRKLPILAKEDFRRSNADAAVSIAYPRESMWTAYTSGTSGTPLRAYFTHEDMQVRIAHLELLYQWYNPKRWRRRASFTGKLIVNTSRASTTVCRPNLAIRQWLFSSHHLSEKYFPIYREDLSRVNPEQIDGILSPIYIVAQSLIASGHKGLIRPRVVVVTSETLWEYMRSVIEQAFGCKVANQYGSQEGAPLAFECERGGFHISAESGIFEVLKLDGSGEPCAPGEVGRLVVTSFVNHGTPLVRYDIGDVAALSADSCPCGRKMPMLAFVHGRAEDMFYTRSRGIVPKVDSAFKSMPAAILATQVAQVGIDDFEVRMAVDHATYRAEYGEQLAHNLTAYLGDVKIKVLIMDKIPVTEGGKVRAQVNECKSLAEFREIREAWDNRNKH
jgi:phenylacetate-CoA ligase